MFRVGLRVGSVWAGLCVKNHTLGESLRMDAMHRLVRRVTVSLQVARVALGI